MSNLVNTLITVFEEKNFLSDKELKDRLSQELKHYLEDNRDLQRVIRQAYRGYMDAEAPTTWVTATERKLKAYCSL